MIQARVALLDAHFDAVRMTVIVEPASLVAPDRIHNECVVSLPASRRVSIPPGIGRVLGAPPNVFGKLAPVGPDFPPQSVELKQLEYLARHGGECNSPGHENHVARESQRIAAFGWVVGIRDREFSRGLVELELLLPPRRHGSDLVELRFNHSGPKSRQIPARRRPPGPT